MRQLILGIETTCDDTALAFVSTDHHLIGHIRLSSAQLQVKYGGVVPEIAARQHAELILPMLIDLIDKYQVKQAEITAIAYSDTPGLLGCLLVARIFAKALSFLWDIPVIPINHIHGHIFSFGLTEEIIFPFISLIASGKTTSLFYVEDYQKITLLNSTVDNAIGEAYDKVGRMLGFDYPAGPKIDALADMNLVTSQLAQYPNVKNNFSFSGIITAAQNFYQKTLINNENKKILTATAFQRWVVAVLCKKIHYYSNFYNCKTLSIAGGVAANSFLRQEATKLKFNLKLVAIEFSGDNAAMIAYYGSFLNNKR